MALWDTADLPEPDQFEFWHEVICRAFVPLTPVRPDRGSGFAAQVETRALGDVNRARLASQTQHTRHGPREVAATSDASYFVNLQLAGRCRVRVEGGEAIVDPGQFVVVDTTRPYWFDFDSSWEMLSYRLPHTAVAAHGAGPLVTGLAIGGDGVGGVVTSLMRALWAAGDPPADATSEALSHAFSGVVAATVPRDRVPMGRQALRTAVSVYVDQHLGGDLSVAAVCRRFAVSARTLHNAFSDDDGPTFAAMVRQQRLDRCRQLLADPTVTTSVIALAHSHGFDDPAAFSRSFRRRHGSSPREVRARACADGTGPVH